MFTDGQILMDDKSHVTYMAQSLGLAIREALGQTLHNGLEFDYDAFRLCIRLREGDDVFVPPPWKYAPTIAIPSNKHDASTVEDTSYPARRDAMKRFTKLFDAHARFIPGVGRSGVANELPIPLRNQHGTKVVRPRGKQSVVLVTAYICNADRTRQVCSKKWCSQRGYALKHYREIRRLRRVLRPLP